MTKKCQINKGVFLFINSINFYLTKFDFIVIIKLNLLKGDGNKLMAEAKRKKNETFESLLRRFNKKLMQSGKLLQAKKIRYLTKEPNKNLTKRLALRRHNIKAKKDYLKKIGKLSED